jgi:glucose-specific phosphotransferase system IIA component
MFSFFKKKEIEGLNLKAFLDGKVVPITEVEDEVFSSKAMGNGVAILPNSEVVVAPAAGEVTLIMDNSFHAIALKLNNGMEILIHIGLETVNMNGEGFTPLVKVGQRVSAGDKLIKFSKESIKRHGYKDITMLVITNSDDYKKAKLVTDIEAKAGETIIVEL